ncbi:Eco57I restriction-modification methylase domain-containing protein [Dehalobacterium formicoaceticum]
MSRATLKPVISKLREIIIKDIAGKMEKYGFDDCGRIAANKPLSEYDSVIKNNLVNLFKGKNIERNRKEYIAYIQDSARTFLHILICFKTMEKRGLIGSVIGRLLKDNIYDSILPDFNNVHPLAFTDLVNKYQDEISKMEEKDNLEEDREYYNFLFMLSLLSKEMATEVPLLFKDYEHNLVHPDFDGLKEILFNINKIEEIEYFEDDFLGWIYQYWVDIKDDELKSAKEDKDVSYANLIYYEILNNLEEEQTQFGEFYTPRWVVKYIVDNTLKPYFEENKKIETIKLLDPACGAGNFLVYAFDVLYDLYKKEHAEWPDSIVIGYILEKNIFGVDIQREPLQITALNLWLKAKKKAQDVRIKNLNLFNMNILKANSLYRWENDQEEIVQLSLFQNEMELTEKQYTAEDIGQYISAQAFISIKEARLFFKNKFNVIVMNPPYLGIRKMKPETSRFLKKEYPKYYSNLFEAFIARAEELLAKNGYLGFVGSDSFMTLDSHDKIRELMLTQFAMKKLIKLGVGVFDGPTVSAAVLVAVKSNKNSSNVVECCDISQKTEGVDALFHDFIKVQQKSFKAILGYPLIFNFTRNIHNSFVKFTPLEKIVEIKQGMITGNNDKFLRNKWEVPNDRLGIDFHPYAKGEGCEKWANNITMCINWSNDGYEIKKEAKEKYGSETRTIKNQMYFFREGITYSDVTSENRFSARYLPAGCIFDTTGSCIFPKTMNTSYMLGFINSKLVNYYLCKLNPSPHFQVCDMQRVPFVEPSRDHEQIVIEKTNRARSIKEYILGFSYISDFYHEVELAYGFSHGAKSIIEAYEIFINKYNELEDELYNLHLEIDEIIYKIYELDELDIKVIEEEFPNMPPKPNKNNDIKKVTLNFIRAIVKDILVNAPAKLYEDTEIEALIKQYIEGKFENGYKIIEEVESILGKSIINVIRGGIKIGSKNITLAGGGSKDLDEPLIQQKVLSGSGNNKSVVIWHLTHFLLEFEENQKYVMQNEIRRYSNDIFRPRLQSIKEKLQGDLTDSARKDLEKQEKLLAETVKTLEAWKVVN